MATVGFSVGSLTTHVVNKDRCLYSFDSPMSNDGVYICLKNFVAVGREYLSLYNEMSGSNTFLHWKQVKRVHSGQNGATDAENESKKPVRMAIGVEGGFDADSTKQIETINTYAVVLYPEFTTFNLDDARLPANVRKVANDVISAESASNSASAAAAAWDGEIREVSRHSFDLVQLPTEGKVIPPSKWKCDRCDLTTNLWLNLSDGTILCGRRFYDGSGGNNHAAEHYEDCKFPLAVKLGTITAAGADVYSYDEGDMVLDPNLTQHLQHWGIDINKLEKTDKTMAQMEIELNQRAWEYRILEESDKKLTPAFGPGLTPIKNLGNTCYFNSIAQVLFSTDDFVSLARKYPEIARSFRIDQIENSVLFQLAKLGFFLNNGQYSPDSVQLDMATCDFGISPYSFKKCIGQLNAEFASSRQQDSHEFLLSLFQEATKAASNNANTGATELTRAVKAFEFEIRQAFVERQNATAGVRFSYHPELALSLSLAGLPAVNQAEFDAYEEQHSHHKNGNAKTSNGSGEAIRRKYRLVDLIAASGQPVAVEGSKDAYTLTTLNTFPDVLAIHIRKFGLNADWSPYKMDIELDVPDVLDFEKIQGENAAAKEVSNMVLTPEPNVAELAVNALVEMGFSRNSAIKALYYTGGSGRKNLETPIEWLMQRVDDIGLEDAPLAPDSYKLVKSSAMASSGPPSKMRKTGGDPVLENLHIIDDVVAMGFSVPQAKNAIRKAGQPCNVERVLDYVLQHPDEGLLDEEVGTSEVAQAVAAEPQSASPLPQDPTYRTGRGVYRLASFVSHMGSSPHCGHYVAHIRKEENGLDKWILFNDEHVTFCEKPPTPFGYIYFYKRMPSTAS